MDVLCSVVSDSLRPLGLQPARLLYPGNFPGKDTGVACHFLLQRIYCHHLIQSSHSDFINYLNNGFIAKESSLESCLMFHGSFLIVFFRQNRPFFLCHDLGIQKILFLFLAECFSICNSPMFPHDSVQIMHLDRNITEMMLYSNCTFLDCGPCKFLP